MKHIITLFLVMSTIFVFGQNKSTPVKWKFEVVESEGEYIFKAVASLDDKWALYSQHTSEGGPVPLSFTYEDSSILIGDTEEKSEAIKKMSELFELEVIKFKDEAIFEQRFERKEGMKHFSGELRYMCCDESRCLPPTVVTFEVAF